MTPKFCPRCGNALQEGAAFCACCGTTVQAAQPSQATQVPPVYQQPYAPYPVQQVVYVNPKVPGKGFGITSMVLGIIGMFYALYMGLVALVMLVAISEVAYGMPSAAVGALSGGMLVLCVFFSIMPVLSVIFGSVAKKRGYINGVSKSGLILGWISLSIIIASTLFTILMAL